MAILFYASRTCPYKMARENLIYLKALQVTCYDACSRLKNSLSRNQITFIFPSWSFRITPGNLQSYLYHRLSFQVWIQVRMVPDFKNRNSIDYHWVQVSSWTTDESWEHDFEPHIFDELIFWIYWNPYLSWALVQICYKAFAKLNLINLQIIVSECLVLLGLLSCWHFKQFFEMVFHSSTNFVW